MSVKIRAANRLLKHLTLIMAIMLSIYVIFLHVPTQILVVVLPLMGMVFALYQIFLIYVAQEQHRADAEK
jgi:hypothetical protein